ncbi:Mu-like prophage I protein [uncultured Clostridium sp.]|nr:Mu-like prophage I protein [uncultured Clostridium sp.]
MNDFLTLKGGEVDVGGAPEVISVLPFGHVVSQKGEFDVDEESLAAMKEQIAQRGVDLVVDYEHQTRVEWTIPAKQYLENKEYRYLSPVITVRKSDNKATGLHSLALTNTPAIAGMTPIVNSSTFQGGETNMNELIKKIAAALGLGEDADEEQILTALSACVEENKALKEAAEGGKAPGKKPGEDGKPEDQDDGIVANKSVCELLGLKAGASTADVAASIMALKGGVDGRVKALEEKLADRDAEEAVELALKSGKITPAQRGWAKGYALKSPDGFKEFLEKAPQAVPMSEIAGGDALALKGNKPDEATMLVCKQLGVSAEDVQKYGMKEE